MRERKQSIRTPTACDLGEDGFAIRMLEPHHKFIHLKIETRSVLYYGPGDLIDKVLMFSLQVAAGVRNIWEFKLAEIKR